MFTHCIIMSLLSSESTRVKNGKPAEFMLPTRPCLPYKIDTWGFRSVQMKTHTCSSLGPPTESKKLIKIVDSEHLCITYGNERLNFAKQQLHTKVVLWCGYSFVWSAHPAADAVLRAGPPAAVFLSVKLDGSSKRRWTPNDLK